MESFDPIMNSGGFENLWNYSGANQASTDGLCPPVRRQLPVRHFSWGEFRDDKCFWGKYELKRLLAMSSFTSCDSVP